MNKEFLHELLLTPSVSGHEEMIQQKAIDYSADFCDEQAVDATGNVIHRLNPEKDLSVLLMGHIDEIGFLVTHIEPNGMIRVMKNGGLRMKLYVGSPVQILHQGKKVSGVVCVESSLEKAEKVEASDLTIDIGAQSAEQAKEYVSVGDPVCADTQVHELLNDNFSSRALDNRTGAFVVMEAIRRARENGTAIGCAAATTVGEETSLRGAYWAAARQQPKLVIAVDVTYVSDCPGTKPQDTGEVKLGGGPVLCTSPIVNKNVNAKLVEIAKEKQIPIQWEVASGHTGTDADTAHVTGAGIPVALVSIPLRYMHSSVETGNYRDIEQCIELLAEFLRQFPEDFCFTSLQVRKPHM